MYKLVGFKIPYLAIGGVYALPAITFLITNVLIQPLKKRVNRRLIIITGSFIVAIAAIFQGPSTFFHIPNKLWIVCVGSALYGVGLGCVFPNALPEIVHNVHLIFKKDKDLNNNYSAGVYRLAQGIGQAIGPIAGTVITKNLSFGTLTDILALIWATYGTLYFIFGGGRDAIRNPPRSNLHSIASSLREDKLLRLSEVMDQMETQQKKESGWKEQERSSLKRLQREELVPTGDKSLSPALSPNAPSREAS